MRFRMGRYMEQDKAPAGVLFDNASVKSLFRILMQNIFVKVGQKIFRQRLGIPMGTDCAPFVANLVLYKMERDWIHKKLANNEYEKLAHFRYAKRYIDDLLLVNNRNQIELAKDEIYG